jgi:uracil-DNA glycosylase family 4
VSALPRDFKDEAAAIARALRAHVRREEAAGAADLLAAGASVADRRESSRAAAPGGTHGPRPEIASGPEVDLFGQPSPGASVMSSRIQTAPAAMDLDTALHPAGSAARAGFQPEALRILGEIATEVRACQQCGLCGTRIQAVPGVGSAASGIVFVGEAPGAEEDRKGEPFVGRAGELLTRIIQAMDDAKLIPGVPLSRQTVYICNVLKCRPPENRNPLPHEIEACSPYLRRQLAALQPRIICCLGKFAAELLVGVKGTIGALRGKVYRYDGAKLLVTYHPAACLRNPAYKRPVWEDMQLLAREYSND